MNAISKRNNDTHTQRQIDWMDVKFALLLGVVAVALKVAADVTPAGHMSRTTIDDLASLLTMGYIIARARRQPEKLDDWGLTTRLTWPALLTGLVLFGISLAVLMAGGMSAAGRLSFKPEYIPQMIEYIPAAFPQQFVMCSIGLATLATLRPFRGLWRLSLTVGVVFSLAHFWTPDRIPGTIIPIQMLITLPSGFCVSLYFLKFRNVLPLTVLHAIIYPLLHNWIELKL